MKNDIKTEARITCPCCFENYWISELMIPDPSDLGNLQGKPIIPSRFTHDGYPKSANADNVNGIEARNYICPKCQFAIPLNFLEHPSVYISMVGAPNVGKTYFSAALYDEVMKLERKYGLSFIRLDSLTNDTLSKYHNDLFEQRTGFVHIEKTQENNDDHYHKYGKYMFPRPHIFKIQPNDKKENPDLLSQGIYLNIYDQAGEDWIKKDTPDEKFRHLRHEHNIVFVLFDPFQEYSKSAGERLNLEEMVTALQDRSSRRKNLKVYVIVTKLDTWLFPKLWKALVRRETLPDYIVNLYKKIRIDKKAPPPLPEDQFPNSAQDFDTMVQTVSDVTKEVLSNMDNCRSFINALEAIGNDITFFPISSTGCQPEKTEGGENEFDREKLATCGVYVPLVYALRTNDYIRTILQSPNIIPIESKTFQK